MLTSVSLVKTLLSVLEPSLKAHSNVHNGI